MSAPPRNIEGYVSTGFEAVRDAFVENFSQRNELGGACCAYHRGRKVVDLWGGVRDESTGAPWRDDTLVIVYSTTKGLAAMTLALAHSRGWLDYDERVAAYWPEFGRSGKEQITVRQLLAHQAGLHLLDRAPDRDLLADLDRLAGVLAEQQPAWQPGTRQGYHAITLGFYEGELMRRIDPSGRSLGRIFQEEIATPLGLDVYIRVPRSIPNSRMARMARPGIVKLLTGFPFRLTREVLTPRSTFRRVLAGSEHADDEATVYARELEIPSGGAVGTARAIARAYSAFATGGQELQLDAGTLQQLAALPVPPARGFHDEVMKDEVRYSLGFMKPGPTWPFGSEHSFGFPGAGGSLGFADPDQEVGYAYVTNRMGTTLTGDPRDVALRDALYASLPVDA